MNSAVIIRSVLIFVCVVFSVSSCNEKKFLPKEGDLVFEVSEPSAFSDAITDATAQKDSIKYSHVAVFDMENGKPYVIEASSKKGVVLTPWQDFVDSSRQINGKPGLVVMRVDKAFPLSEAVKRAKSLIGESYDWSFLPDNGKMYCSELVYMSYRYKDGTPVFTEHPMNFLDSKGEMPAFWTELFNKLGEPVPQGVPGTNPNDMSKEPVLKEVHRYF
ncbi:MAG: hypothetical protein LKI42_04255 [Bacteroidales bacterium]|nr:hypothetical protein [Bacteroidales bacterium]MCI1786211.1 hypothetical protein [Bacteroidales bacterium]